MGKWHRAGGPRAPACGRRVEHVLAPPWLDHRFELITHAQIESGAPSPALGHLLARETVSATARETGTVGEWQRSPRSGQIGSGSRGSLRCPGADPGEPRSLAAPGRANTSRSRDSSRLPAADRRESRDLSTPGRAAPSRLRCSPRSTPGRLEESRDPDLICSDRGTPRDRPPGVSRSPAIRPGRPGPGHPNRRTPRERPRTVSRSPAIWSFARGRALQLPMLSATPAGNRAGARGA